jgi:CBS domain-containing protein
MRLLDDLPDYRAFLLRLWKERGCAPELCPWRFSLEDPHTGERRGFGNLMALLAWLRAETMGEPPLADQRQEWIPVTFTERRYAAVNRSLRTVSDILKLKGHETWSVTPEMTVFEALQLMADKGIGAVVVMDDGKLVGVMSERDYARKVILKGKASRDIPVREIMTEKVVTVYPDTLCTECMAVMTEKHIRHLPVVEMGKLVGVVSIGDVVKAIISEQQYVIERQHQMWEYAQP